MDRRLGKWENIMQATHVISENIRDRVTFKSFGVGKGQGKPQRHGDFNDLEFWNDDVLDAQRPPVDAPTQELEPTVVEPQGVGAV